MKKDNQLKIPTPPPSEKQKLCKHLNWKYITCEMIDLIMIANHIHKERTCNELEFPLPTQIVHYIFKHSLKHLNIDDFDTMLNNKKLWSIMQYIYKILKYYIQSKPSQENIHQWRFDLHLKVVGFLISSGKYLQGYEKNQTVKRKHEMGHLILQGN